MAKKKYFVVVEIGLKEIKVVTFDGTDSKLLSAVIKDYSQFTKDQDRKKFVVSAIRKAIPPKILKQATAFICLSDSIPQIKRIELPHMPLNEIAEALRWRIKSLVSFDIDKAVLDFDIIGETTDKQGTKKYNLIMAAMPKEEVNKKISLLKEAGLKTIGGVNVDSFSMSQIIALTPEGKEKKTSAVLNLGYTQSTVNIYEGSKLTFVRNIPVGLRHIKEFIKGPVVSDKGPIELTTAEMAQLKDMGIPADNDSLLGGKLQGRHMLALLRPVLENICSEIRRSFDYYKTHMEGNDVSKLYLMGSGSRYKNLDIFIKNALRMETEYLGLPDSYFGVAKQDEERIRESMAQIIPLIGAACGGIEKKVNLLPIEYKMEKIQKVEKISIRMVGFAALAVLIVSFVLVNVRVSDYKRRLTNAKNQMRVLQEIKDLYDRIAEREKLINTVRALEVPNIWLMKELSNIIPANTMLSKFAIDQGEGIVKFEGVIRLDSDADEAILTDFMGVLENSPFFKDVDLESSQKGEFEGMNVASFIIICVMQR